MARRDGKLGPGGGKSAADKVEGMGTPPKAYLRKVVFDDMSCVLIVDAQGTDPLPPEAVRNRFLQSLKRTGKPIW